MKCEFTVKKGAFYYLCPKKATVRRVGVGNYCAKHAPTAGPVGLNPEDIRTDKER